MTACLSLEDARELIYKLATEKEIDSDGRARVDIHNISDLDVQVMMENGNINHIANKILSKPIRSKLQNALKPSRKFRDQSKAFYKLLKDTGNLRENSLALQTILESIKGEIDKANNLGLEIGQVSSDGVTPNLALHRLAATIGRKILYKKGFRATKKLKGQPAPIEVELVYYDVGMKAIQELQKAGLLKVNKKGSATIKDYLDDIEDRPAYKEADIIVADNPSISLNLEAFGLDPENNAPAQKNALKYLTDRPTSDISKHELGEYVKILSAINMVSEPNYISLPSTEPVKGKHRLDVYTPEEKSQKARKEIGSKPLFIDKDLHRFFSMLHDATLDTGESASTAIRQLMNRSPELMQSLFRMDIDNEAVSENESVRGRNLSNSVPVDDLVEYWESFANADQGFFMEMFAGRNTRMYIENSVLNPHASKIVRHALAVKEYSYKTGTPEYKFMVGKVAHLLGVSPDELLGTTQNKELNKALNYLERYQTGKNLAAMAGALSFMHDFQPNMNFAELISTLKAAKAVRDSVDSGTVTSTFPVSSDATASGGTLTLLEALGSDSAVEELLTDMGILGSLKGKDRKLKDVYHILKKKLDMYLRNEEDPEGFNTKQSKGTPELTKKVLELASKTLYKDIRDLAKKPTMTFIYGQSKAAAEVTLAQELTEKTIAKLQAGDPGAIDLINAVMETEYTTRDVDMLLKDAKLKKTLISHFNDSGAPGFLYDTLEHAITNTYLFKHQARQKAVFKLLDRYSGLSKMRMLPAAAALHFGQPDSHSRLEKYGVPLQKIFEVRHDKYGPPVLTREGKLQPTILSVSMTHSKDAGSLFRSLEGLPTKYDSGVITVHDQMMGAPALIMEGEKNYIKETMEIAKNYDILEQALLAAPFYDSEIKNDPEYVQLMNEIKAAKETRQKALENFNLETDSIIGDPIETEFTMPESTVPEDTAKKSESRQDTKPAAKAAKPQAATVKLETLAGDSEIISAFLESSNAAKVDTGEEAKFDPQTDTIILPKGTTDKQAVELAEHEIVHSYTSAVIQQYYQNGGIQGIDPFSKQSDINIAYIEKAVKRLQSLAGSKIDTLPPEVARVVWKIASSDTPTGVAELISVLSAEPKVAEAIYGLLNEGPKGKLRMIVERIVARIREVLRNITIEDLEEKRVDINLLYSAVNAAIAEGKTMREQNYDTVLDLQKGFGDLYAITDDRFIASRYVDSINAAVARGINDPILRSSGNLLKQADMLLQHFPMYKVARDKIAGIYESSSELQQLVHAITNENIDKEKKNKILSAFSAIRAEKAEITSVELTKFTHETSKLTKAEKKDFYDFVHRMPIHDVWMLELDNVSDVKAELGAVAAKFSDSELQAMDSIVDLRVHEKVTPTSFYTIKSIFDPVGDRGIEARKYIVLKTINEIGVEKWENFKSKNSLFELTRDASLANAMLNSQQENQLLGDTLVRDEPPKPVMVRAVTTDEISRYSFEEKSGWKILQEPTATKPGIIYKNVIDQTYMEGAFTDMKFNSSDVDVDERFKKMENVVKTPSGYKLILTTEQKEAAGILNNAEQGLVRSMTHAMALQDSQNIRDRLLQRDTYFDLKNDDIARLQTAIKDKDTDHHWFLSGGIEYHKLPKDVQAKYMPVDKKLSDVNGFNEKIKYVRKDIAHWLTGKTEKSLFNDPKLQWATRITKDLVAGAKIGMVILNPLKIFKDNVSNVAYLSVRGVDPLYIQKQYRQISKEFHDFQQMKNKMNHLRVKAIAEPNREAAIKKQVAKLEKQIKAHPAYGILERGFINSLGSDIVMRAGDPSAGFKHDIDAVLKYLFKSQDGDNNAAGRLIMKLANWNVGIEEFLETFGKIPGAVDSTKNFEKEVNSIAKRMRGIKSEDDVISYMHQYLNSPDSDFVKMGTYMTDLTDILSKETLYRYLVEKGVDPKKAEIDVIDSFPDYKENLPTRVKQLSDVGILMFPSYWLRIQKAIFRMVRDQPVSFGTEMGIEALMGVEHEKIFDANIVSKATSNYGLVHTPWEHMGWNSIFPTNIL